MQPQRLVRKIYPLDLLISFAHEENTITTWISALIVTLARGLDSVCLRSIEPSDATGMFINKFNGAGVTETLIPIVDSASCRFDSQLRCESPQPSS